VPRKSIRRDGPEPTVGPRDDPGAGRLHSGPNSYKGADDGDTGWRDGHDRGVRRQSDTVTGGRRRVRRRARSGRTVCNSRRIPVQMLHVAPNAKRFNRFARNTPVARRLHRGCGRRTAPPRPGFAGTACTTPQRPMQMLHGERKS